MYKKSCQIVHVHVFSHLVNIYCVNLIFILELKNVAVYDFKPLDKLLGRTYKKKSLILQ